MWLLTIICQVINFLGILQTQKESYGREMTEKEILRESQVSNSTMGSCTRLGLFLNFWACEEKNHFFKPVYQSLGCE